MISPCHARLLEAEPWGKLRWGEQNDQVVSAKPPFILPNLLLNKNPHLLISSGKNSTKSMSVTQSLTQKMPIFTTIPIPSPSPKVLFDFRFHPQKWWKKNTSRNLWHGSKPWYRMWTPSHSWDLWMWITHSKCIYPLVNVYITMERSTIFHGKIHYFDWAIFNSYVSHYQRV